MFSHQVHSTGAKPGCRSGRHGGGGEHSRHFAYGPRGEFGGFGGHRGGPRGRGRKARRGDIRTAALLLLAEEPRNGYQIMQELEQRSGGIWRPSPGSVYPILQSLEDEGLVTAESNGGRRSYSLTETGRETATAPGTPSPWDEFETPIDSADTLLQETTRHLVSAVNQVLASGTHDQKARAVDVLAQARRTVYAVLAEDL